MTRRIPAATPRALPFETVALAFLCTLDAVSTLYLVARGMAVEANPLLRWTFDLGPGAFLAVKMASFVPALIILERIRPVKPALVKVATWAALLGYAAIYVLGSLQINAAVLGSR